MLENNNKKKIKHGKWIGFYGDTCSECGWAISENFNFDSGWKYGALASEFNYCPICGARMDEKE